MRERFFFFFLNLRRWGPLKNGPPHPNKKKTPLLSTFPSLKKNIKMVFFFFSPTLFYLRERRGPPFPSWSLSRRSPYTTPDWPLFLRLPAMEKTAPPLRDPPFLSSAAKHFLGTDVCPLPLTPHQNLPPFCSLLFPLAFSGTMVFLQGAPLQSFSSLLVSRV